MQHTRKEEYAFPGCSLCDACYHCGSRGQARLDCLKTYIRCCSMTCIQLSNTNTPKDSFTWWKHVACVHSTLLNDPPVKWIQRIRSKRTPLELRPYIQKIKRIIIPQLPKACPWCRTSPWIPGPLELYPNPEDTQCIGLFTCCMNCEEDGTTPSLAGFIKRGKDWNTAWWVPSIQSKSEDKVAIALPFWEEP